MNRNEITKTSTLRPLSTKGYSAADKIYYVNFGVCRYSPGFECIPMSMAIIGGGIDMLTGRGRGILIEREG